MSPEELAEEKKRAHEVSLATLNSSTSSEAGESSKAIAIFAWLAVGLPLAYGIWVTLQKSAVLFK
jgi:hypothetical protein